ncbi:ogr/Delta-like zinc finger family protein [Zobellella denitrificans]|uniref:ogr/Delta-like zinc finger family protein n=1 Tax=Zobellella denitrificans TaxID=347534 RepID=UPI000BBE82C5|nr:ogr/Delta-like zinc finger family protein [Zobellella denitrificans]
MKKNEITAGPRWIRQGSQSRAGSASPAVYVGVFHIPMFYLARNKHCIKPGRARDWPIFMPGWKISLLKLLGGKMRFTCRACGAKATITKNHRISADYAELYISCSEVLCGHRWVESVGYSHDLAPSQLPIRDSEVFRLISSMPPAEREELVERLKKELPPVIEAEPSFPRIVRRSK